MTQTGDSATPAGESVTPQPRKQSGLDFFKSNFKAIGISGAVIILAAGYFHQTQVSSDLQHQNQKLSHPQANTQAQASTLRDEVATLIELPRGETPTIATVEDINKLKNQPFFTKAQNGDKVLMFAKGKEAILYRPGVRKIIQVAPLNPGSAAANAGSTGPGTNLGGTTAP